MSSTRQLAAILFTDIAGYTAKMQRDEQSAIAMVKHHRAVLEKTVAGFDGNVIEFYGDVPPLCTVAGSLIIDTHAIRKSILLTGIH